MTNEITPEIAAGMNRRRAIRTFASSLLFALTAFAALPDSTASAAAQADPGQPYAQPFVKLDKTRFAEGEEVFFWVGLRRTTEVPVPIPKEFWNTCRLTIIRPDGTRKTRPSGWPVDGPTGSTWEGGSGLGEKAVPGQYTLIFEFAGKKSAPATLTVERAAILSGIEAEFVFGSPEGSAETSPAGSDTPVTLTVQNNTDQTILFPCRDGFSSIVWVRFAGRDEKREIGTSYPEEKLLAPGTKPLNFSFSFFTYEMAKRVPIVVLKPGETYRQRLSLGDAAAHARKQGPYPGGSLPPGRYDVGFATVLPVLIGEAGGAFSALSPVRIPVGNTGLCTVPAAPVVTATAGRTAG